MEKVSEVFRNSIKEDFNFILPSPISIPTQLNKIKASMESYEGENAEIKKIFPVFDKYFFYYLADNSTEISDSIYTLIQEAENDTYYIFEKEHETGFLLFPLPEYHSKEIIGICEALQYFIRRYYSRKRYFDEKQKLTQIFNTNLKKWKDRYDKAKELLHSINHERSAFEIANIIMANLHQISKGATTIILDDFYQNIPITIPLNPNLSAQENASRLYEKHKETEIRIKHAQLAFSEAENKLDIITTLHAEFLAAKNNKALETIQSKLPIWAKKIDIEADKTNVPFRIFEIDNYIIWVGKNSTNNDILTFKYAHKEDWWLHAKDVSGAHVVIKHKKKGVLPPKNVLEYAGGLAAYYSSQKNNSLATVTLTQKKYVRKGRKMAPGQVIIEREKTLMVPPQKPNVLL